MSSVELVLEFRSLYVDAVQHTENLGGSLDTRQPQRRPRVRLRDTTVYRGFLCLQPSRVGPSRAGQCPVNESSLLLIYSTSITNGGKREGQQAEIPEL